MFTLLCYVSFYYNFDGIFKQLYLNNILHLFSFKTPILNEKLINNSS